MTPETYELLEDAVQKQLIRIETLDTESKEGKESLAKSIQLVDLLVTVDKNNDDYHDKEERRKIEDTKNNAVNEIERDKQKVTWSRVAFEMTKVIVPLVIQVVAFGALQKRMFKFEETGRITSDGGRQMHLPKFWK